MQFRVSGRVPAPVVLVTRLRSSVEERQGSCLRPFGTFPLVRSDTVRLDAFVPSPDMLYWLGETGRTV
ncbi:hypothetical protein KSC_029660 [Ktedonobacter sp. SOSP1-52]|nr:hypothetical protein KSC_029660 [Ktedonobacter sp. SOSP1-52]